MFREGWIDRPLEFLPERWATDNPQLPELKEMFLPFSLGKRACIGQNMAMFQLRVVTAYLLHHFDFTLVGEPDFEYFLTLKPVNVWLAVKERNLWISSTMYMYVIVVFSVIVYVDADLIVLFNPVTCN